MDRGLAYRRHHEQRMKDRVANYYGGWASRDERALGMVARTQTLCSCPMCGNPRRHFGEVTLQEKIADARMEEEIGEVAEWSKAGVC